MRIVFVADVFGPPGREAVESLLPGLRDELGAALAVVNGENVADGRGITPRLADRLLAAGADVVTLGNHTWARDGMGPYLAASERVIRPANFAAGTPGRGLAIVEADDGTPVAVCNVLGQLFLEVSRSPFEVLDSMVEEARKHANVVLVDFHAEATSEKIAVARMLDGRVTAVIGTHTHVQTADARILPGGTAAITDAGMTGPHDSVIGVEAELAIQRMRTGIPVRFKPAKGGIRLEGVVLDCDPGTGKATAVEPLRVELG
jgi:metallophosphoesterase (TIGR00282 family)